MQAVQEPQETWVQSLGQEDPWEVGMATYSSILALENPMDRGVWCGLQSMGSQSQIQLRDFHISWTVARQAPLSMGFSKARILEWVAVSFSRGSSRLRVPTCVSCISGGFFAL